MNKKPDQTFLMAFIIECLRHGCTPVQSKEPKFQNMIGAGYTFEIALGLISSYLKMSLSLGARALPFVRTEFIKWRWLELDNIEDRLRNPPNYIWVLGKKKFIIAEVPGKSMRHCCVCVPGFKVESDGVKINLRTTEGYNNGVIEQFVDKHKFKLHYALSPLATGHLTV